MESHKVFPRRSLLCLVVVSLLYLIDNTQGLSSNLTHRTENSSTKEIQDSSAVNLTKLNNSNRFTEIETTTWTPSEELGREAEGRHLFLGPNVHRKRKPVLIPRNTKKPTSVQISSKPNLGLSERMDDGEFSFDNSTETDKRNRTVIIHDKADPVIVEEDNFCPEGRSARGANPLQSTLPAAIFMLNAAVHVIGLMVFLYYYKAYYAYDIVDPYVTVSPYGIGPPTPPPPTTTTAAPKMKRSITGDTGRIGEIMYTLHKSLVHIKKEK